MSLLPQPTTFKQYLNDILLIWTIKTLKYWNNDKKSAKTVVVYWMMLLGHLDSASGTPNSEYVWIGVIQGIYICLFVISRWDCRTWNHPLVFGF